MVHLDGLDKAAQGLEVWFRRGLGLVASQTCCLYCGEFYPLVALKSNARMQCFQCRVKDVFNR